MKMLNLSDPTKLENYVKRGAVVGTPLHWRDDTTGQIQAAIMAYLNQEPTPEQLRLVIKYVQHHIHAPCFLEESPFGEVDEWMAGRIRELRKQSLDLETIEDVNAYTKAAMEVGLDPL